MPQQHRGRDQEDAGQHQEGWPPAKVVYRIPAEQLSGHHAGQRGTGKPRQRFLASLIRHLVTDPGDRQRHDACGGCAHEGPAQDQPLQGACERRQQAEQGAGKGGSHHHAQLADAVAHGPVEELGDAVGYGKRRHHCRRIPRADPELLAQRDQHRVADAHRRGAAKRRQRDGPQAHAGCGSSKSAPSGAPG
jgi:hypothetical protein